MTIERKNLELPRMIWKIIRFPPRIWYGLGLGRLLGRWILLLQTIGRKSGKIRVTALQHQYIDGSYFVGSAWGARADWVRNIQANPSVEIRIKSMNRKGSGKVITDPSRIADFLQIRIEKGPWLIRRLLKCEGLPVKPTRGELVAFAGGMVVVKIQPYPPDGISLDSARVELFSERS